MDMRVTGSHNIYNVYQPQKVQTTERITKAEDKRDAVMISNEAKEFQAAVNAVKNAPDIREDKVKDLKDKIDKGEYQVSGQQIAEKLLKKL